MGGGLWEGSRSINGRIQFAEEHLIRLFDSAYALKIDIGVSKLELLMLLHQTGDANGMENSPTCTLHWLLVEDLNQRLIKIPS